MERPDLNEWAVNFGPVRLRRRLLLRRAVPQLADREAGAREPGPLEGDPEAELLVDLFGLWGPSCGVAPIYSCIFGLISIPAANGCACWLGQWRA